MKKKVNKVKVEPKPAQDFISFASMQPLFDIHKNVPLKPGKKRKK